jgi:ribonuclease R
LARNPKSPDVKPLPNREAVLAFMAEGKGGTKRDIARAFGLHGANKLALKAMLKELQGEGLIEKSRKSLHSAGTLPAIALLDIIERDKDGELIAIPAEWPASDKAPRILLHPQKRGDGPAAGVGDRVLARVEPTREKGVDYTGRITKILARKTSSLLGIYRSLPDGSGRFVPVDKKSQGREIEIAASDRNGAEDGDLIAVEAAREGRFARLKAKVRERLGSVKSEKAVSLIAIHAHDIPFRFSAEVMREAEEAKPAGLAGREDWRALPLITIDPADAKDHDDAVHAARDDDAANEGGFILTIAIADVAAYVKAGSALDKEAFERGNSVYFPDRVVPMLPERISNDLCSLRPNEDRPALAVRAIIDRNGRKKSHSFHRILMRSAAKLAYPQAQAAVDGHPDDLTGPLIRPILSPLYSAYDALRKARDNREPLDLDLPERKLVLNADGTVKDIIIPARLDAHRLIEEMMILANVCAAETLEKEKTPLLYRVHDEPSLDKMESLRLFLGTVGIELPHAGSLRPSLFNRILARVAETEHQAIVNEVVLRSQAQAVYAPENLGHFGLNLRRYAHFTSPIRRYADLIVHRALIRALALGDDGLKDMSPDRLVEIGERISAAERRAMAAERETIDRLIAHHLADQVGAAFTARITGVNRAGLFLRLAVSGADGFVPAASLGADYFVYDEVQHAMTGAKSGESFRLGDVVSVKLVEVAPVAGALRFEMISEGRYVKPTRRGPPGKRGGNAPGADAQRAKIGHKRAMKRGKKR